MNKVLSNNNRIDTLLTTDGRLFNPVISFDQLNLLGRGVEVTYNFPTFAARNADVSNFEALIAAQKSAVRDVLEMISSYVDVTFREVSSNTSAQIEFAVGTLGGNTQGLSSSLFSFVGFNHGFIRDVTITFDNALAAEGDFGPGSRFYLVAIHEIGHAIGLDHPFDDATEINKISGVNSDTASTVMAYEDGFSGSGLEPSTLMKNDFLALQYLYGENTSTHSGDTVHYFTDGDFRGEEGISLLWDASGNDTIDLNFIRSNSSTSSGGEQYYTISLTPGDRLLREPSAGSHFDNIFIADGAVFENVVGTKFDDRVTGTSSSNKIEGGNGEDELRGFAGDDELHGNAFVYAPVIEDRDSLVDTDGWLIQFADDSGILLGSDLTVAGQAINTFFEIETTELGVGKLADDNMRDELWGDDGNDTMFGGGGNDLLVGGRGDDEMTGGAGADEFLFNEQTGRDIITDFTATQDALLLANGFWPGTLSAAQVVDQYGTQTADAYVFDFGDLEISLLGTHDETALANSIQIS